MEIHIQQKLKMRSGIFHNLGIVYAETGYNRRKSISIRLSCFKFQRFLRTSIKDYMTDRQQVI
jgi:hypothetical protein